MEDNSIYNILLGLFCIVIMGVFFLLPHQKKTKKEAEFSKKLAVGDKVVTIGGIHGIIVDFNDAHVILQMEDGHARILLDKACVSFEATTHFYPNETKKQKVNKSQ